MEPIVRTLGHHSVQLLVTIASHSTYIRLQYRAVKMSHVHSFKCSPTNSGVIRVLVQPNDVNNHLASPMTTIICMSDKTNRPHHASLLMQVYCKGITRLT